MDPIQGLGLADSESIRINWNREEPIQSDEFGFVWEFGLRLIF